MMSLGRIKSFKKKRNIPDRKRLKSKRLGVRGKEGALVRQYNNITLRLDKQTFVLDCRISIMLLISK